MNSRQHNLGKSFVVKLFGFGTNGLNRARTQSAACIRNCAISAEHVASVLNFEIGACASLMNGTHFFKFVFMHNISDKDFCSSGCIPAAFRVFGLFEFFHTAAAIAQFFFSAIAFFAFRFIFPSFSNAFYKFDNAVLVRTSEHSVNTLQFCRRFRASLRKAACRNKFCIRVQFMRF